MLFSLRHAPKCYRSSDELLLLVSEAERVAGQLQRAFRNAARKALLWPQEAADLEMTKPCIKKMALCLLARALEERR